MNLPTTTTTSVEFQGQSIRTVVIDGAPWFVVTDICGVLGLADPSTAIRRLDDDEKRRVKVDTDGGLQELNVVDESGLYSLIFVSNKPEAIRFRKSVTREILPSLRRAASGERQDLKSGAVYCSLPGAGRFRVTLEETGRLTVDEMEPMSFVSEIYSAEVDALALATCVVGAVWRKYQVLDALSALNSERSNTRHQLAEAIKQAQQLARSAMYTKGEWIDRKLS